MTAFGQYEGDDSGSTCKQRDYKDATDLVVQPMNVTQDTVAGPLDSHYWKGLGSRQGGEREYVGVVQPAIAFAQNSRDEVRLVGGDGQTVGALAAQPGMKQTTYLATEVTGTLSSRTSAGGGLGTDFEVAGGLLPVLAPTLTAANDPSRSPQSTEVTNQVAAVLAAQPTMAVRRLMPVETERLQGFPDDWTNIPWRGKPAPDGPRYKAMGNSMAVPVMRWIGQRLDRVAKGTVE
jgi:DNA (cytosine-5)-methyltransferase 1